MEEQEPAKVATKPDPKLEAKAADRVTGRATQSEYTDDQGNFIRFQYELEFVQLLSNPEYLNCTYSLPRVLDLVTNGRLDEPAFINFLAYLQYWKKPEYAKFLSYPMSLCVLDMLQHKVFRDMLKNPEYREAIQLQIWRHDRYSFFKLNQKQQP